MTLIGSPHPTPQPYGPRVAAASGAAVVMLVATLLVLAGLVVGTGGDPNAGLTYQLALWWTLLATIGAVAGSVILAKRFSSGRGPWRGALRGALVAVGLALLVDLVGYGVLLGVHRLTGA